MNAVVEAGCVTLSAALDDAVRGERDPERITRRVRDVLTELIHAGAVHLPEAVREPVPGSYARRLVCANPDLGYTALAMVWGVGQGTAVHDHAGLWCVEGVVEGRITVTQYELLERDGKRCRFDRKEPGEAGVGSAGRLIPPHDYHTIQNALPDQPSITIHVYGGEMDHCFIYEPRENGWYEEIAKTLTLTA